MTGKLKRIYWATLYRWFNKNKDVMCPFCKWEGKQFLPFGVVKRGNARCPKCGSLERHRLYYLYLKKTIDPEKSVRVLHFAPEKILTKLFQSYPKVEYISADIDPAKAMEKQDITQLTYADDSFDLIFCSHVLEHIVDEQKALRELKRVLKPGGAALLQVPMKDRQTSYEDATIVDPAERLKAFGQKDHVRIYGWDYPERLRRAGWSVTVEKFLESLPPEMVKKFALFPQDESCLKSEGWIYRCQ